MRCMQFGQQSIIGDGRINAIGSRSFSLDSRRCSLVDLTVSRHARRKSVQHQQLVIPQEPSNYNASTTVAQRCPQTKLLGKYLLFPSASVTLRILIKFYMADLHRKLSGEFSFCPPCFAVTPAVLEGSTASAT